VNAVALDRESFTVADHTQRKIQNVHGLFCFFSLIFRLAPEDFWHFPGWKMALLAEGIALPMIS
jgi:hypothetical protein